MSQFCFLDSLIWSCVLSILDKGCKLHHFRRCPWLIAISNNLGTFLMHSLFFLLIFYFFTSYGTQFILNVFPFQGNHPDDDQPIVLKLAKGGFSIRHRRTIAPVPKVNIVHSKTCVYYWSPILYITVLAMCFIFFPFLYTWFSAFWFWDFTLSPTRYSCV